MDFRPWVIPPLLDRTAHRPRAVHAGEGDQFDHRHRGLQPLREAAKGEQTLQGPRHRTALSQVIKPYHLHLGTMQET